MKKHIKLADILGTVGIEPLSWKGDGTQLDIIGIGTPCIDMLTLVDALPTPNKGATVLEVSRQGGGQVATALVTASRLGAHTSFIGVSGSCIHGRAIRDDFSYNHVDISHSIIHEGASSDFAYILSDMETIGRSIMYRRGTVRDIEIKDLDKDFIVSADFLHLESCNPPQALAAGWMREAGKKVVYDAGSYSPKIHDFLPKIDVFIASEFYYQECFPTGGYEENCCRVADHGPEIVVFTLGEKGCVGYSKKEGYFEAEGFNVPVRDTLGAGDVFHGAFLYGLVKGMPVRENARFSNAVAAIKISAIGGRAGIPSYETTIKFMQTGIIDTAQIEQRIQKYQDMWLFTD